VLRPPWLAIVALAAACTSEFQDRTIRVKLTEREPTAPVASLEHNFLDARRSDGNVEGDLVETVDFQRDIPPFYVYTHVIEGDRYVVEFPSRTLEGTLEDGVLTATWSNGSGERRTTALDAYVAETFQGFEEIWTIAMTLDEGPSRFEIISAESAEYSEPDLWDPLAVGITSTRIPSGELLAPAEGSDLEFVANLPDVEDCEADPCVFAPTVTTTRVFDVDVSASGLRGFDSFSARVNQPPPFGLP